MGKKKGGKKGGYDDDIWADDLLQEDPIQAAVAAEANAGGDDAGDDAGGGLMSMISRAKKNKKGNKAPAASFAALADEDNDMLNNDEEEEEEEPAAAELSDDAEAPGMASKKNKKNKKKNKSGASTPLPGDGGAMDASLDSLDAEPEVVIKSAKQKEREKKEKAKLLKKQKAAEAKAKKEAELRELEESLGGVKIDDAPAAADGGEDAGAADGGSKKKNKKKKKGKKDDADADADEPAAPEPAAATAGKKDKDKKKKKGAPIAALQKMVEEQRRLEEEQRRLEEEERRRIEEEERLAAEEEARIAAEREAKKEADRLRREQLKREGKLLTKKQKEAKARQEQQLKALLASGVQVAGLADGEQKEDSKGGRRGNHKEAEERKRRAAERKRKEEEEERKRKEEEEAKRKQAEAADESGGDGADDDWEALLESSEDEEPSAGSGDEDGAKDSWDQSSEEEEEEEEEEEKKGAKPKPKAAEESDEDDSEESDDYSDDSDDDSSEEEMTAAERQVYERKQAAAARRQQRVKDAMAARSADDLRSPICCILGHVDTGKCFGKDTPLLMADGTTRAVQDIKAGELLMGDDCTPRQVQAGSLVHETGNLYRVVPDAASGAESFVCNGEHILVLVNIAKPWVESISRAGVTRYLAQEVHIGADKKPHTRTIGEFDTESAAQAALPAWTPAIWEVPVLDYLATNVQDRSRWAVYMPEGGVEYPADAVEPLTVLLREVFGHSASTELEQHALWWLGLWLATGSSSQPHIYQSTSAEGKAAAPAVKKHLLECGSLFGVDAVESEDASSSASYFDFGSKFAALLSRLSLVGNRHIPDAAMRSSKDNRRALLAGLIDGAGLYSSKGSLAVEGAGATIESWDVTSSSTELLVGIKKLARSVGLRAGAIANQTIAVGGPAMQPVNQWIRHGSKHATAGANDQFTNYRLGSSAFEIESLGSGEYFGFTVTGPNSRFLLGDFTVTHNTKLLDKIRQTNVQEGEAGGITQQIGATYFPADAIKMKTASINKGNKLDIRVPGLLIIDTPGHESFTNLRSRGSSLCNIAILVVDIMHGLEPQTLESLRLLRDRKTPFIVALNKIDRIYDWKAIPNSPFRETLKAQPIHAQREFANRVSNTITAFAEQGLNSKLYYENKNFAKYVSLVPTSAISGEGIPDLLALLVSLTQSRMSNQLMYLSELECTVLEVKVVEGLGTTIDVVLSNGVLHEGDRIVVCGLDGPIVTNVRALLTPQPMRELRVKSAYVHHKSIKAAMGVKITAPGLDKAIAGSRLMVVGPDDDEEELMDEIMSDLTSLQDAIDKSGRGVWVQASTLGSLEALLEFLRVSKIPVSGINIGPVHKKDVTRASAMLEKAKEFAVMLCFDVKVDKDAQDMAEELGVKVFKADIIYHLFDAFTAYNAEIMEQKRKDQAPQAIFPCVIKMIKGAAFNKRDPLILGVDVLEGQLRQGTPVCVSKFHPETKTREIINLGKVTSMEINHKQVEIVRKGEAGAGVAIRIDCPVYDTPKAYGRHFDDNDEIYSRITRGSIDVLKESFRNDLSKDDWGLVIKLKKILDIN